MANELSVLKTVDDIRHKSDDIDIGNRRELQRLEDENRKLRRDLEDAQAEKERLSRSVKHLRDMLGPFYRGFRALFGEIELAVGESVANGAAVSQSSNSDPRWESYKKQLGNIAGEIVDALLVHNEMTLMQLAKLLHHDYKTIAKIAGQLRSAGAVTYSAREPLRLKR
jgi:FtsZ-binding cell division protein ZapB